MTYFLSEKCALKRLEAPCVYNIRSDELYELDGEAFNFLSKCASPEGCEARPPEMDFVEYCRAEGILIEEAWGGRLLRDGASPVPSLRYLELQITRRCNLRCRHCYIGPPEDKELSPEEVRAIFEEFEEMQGLRAIITGGEPLMHRDFNTINELLPKYALRKILVTNGTLLTGEILKTLNVDEIQVSIDGLEVGHEALRGRGTFGLAMRCIKEAVRAGFDVSVSTMVHSRNLDDFDELEDTLRAIGVKDWVVDIPCPEGNLKSNQSLSLSPETAGPYLRYGWGEGLHGDTGSDSHACGLHLMSVMADGDCSRCAFYAENPIGHISEGLLECWKRIKPTKLSDLDCDCDVLSSCRGGCRYRASLLGNPHGKDLYRCVYYDRL